MQCWLPIGLAVPQVGQRIILASVYSTTYPHTDPGATGLVAVGAFDAQEKADAGQ